MKRNGIWQSQSRWQNGHYQSVKKDDKGWYRLTPQVIELTYHLTSTQGGN